MQDAQKMDVEEYQVLALLDGKVVTDVEIPASDDRAVAVSIHIHLHAVLTRWHIRNGVFGRLRIVRKLRR